MNINEHLTFITQILYILLSIVAIIDYMRHGTPRRRDFALVAIALGFPLSITLLRTIRPFESSFLNIAGAFALFSQPYFLFRLLQYFRPSRRGVGTLVIVGLVSSCALLYFRVASNPVVVVTLIFTYCTLVEAYCTLGFYQGLRGTQGTLRRRLWIITLSSAVFSLAFFINAIKTPFPTLSPSITPIAQVAAAISAIFFYVAFIPPRWLRRAWQMEELRNFLSQSRVAPDSDHFVAERFQQLSHVANLATNGAAGGVLSLDDAADEWTVLATTDSALFTNLLQNAQPLLRRTWQQRQVVSAFVPHLHNAAERSQLQTLGVRTWLLVPVLSQTHRWGMLVVALRDRSLFIDDDLRMLELLAQECALVLDNHRLIDELQEYSGQLEAKVEERTVALQRSNEELRRYAYVASHDLQEPLRKVTSYLQLIEQRFPDKLDEEGREFIAFAVDGALRMKNLISDLLMYSRVESRARAFATLDVKDVLNKATHFLDMTITETGARITCDPLPKIVADEVLMLQIFQNIIGNALKYRSDRQPEIHVGVTNSNGNWTFHIRDNGIGIPEEFLDRIFVIFQRLHTHEKYPGTGIGLAVCKKAVELHEGRIWVESQVGKGTTFYFTIPERQANTSNGYTLSA